MRNGNGWGKGNGQGEANSNMSIVSAWNIPLDISILPIFIYALVNYIAVRNFDDHQSVIT